MRSRLIAATFVLTLGLLGCSSKPVPPSGEPVRLLTGAMPFDADECTSDAIVAKLLVDRLDGVSLAVYETYGAGSSHLTPVMWPPGFTGRRVGSEVVVADPQGNAVATTGESYRMSGNILVRDPNRSWPNRDDKRYRRGWVNSLVGVDMFYACGVGPPTAPPTQLPMI